MPNNNLTRFAPQRFLRAGKDFDYCPLDGDIPLLQFVNTQSKRNTLRAKNYLYHYTEFLKWSYEIKMIDEETYDSLELEARCYEKDVAGLLNQVLIVRSNFYLLLDCILHDEPVPPGVMSELNDANDAAGKHVKYAMTPHGLREVWHNTHEELAFPLWAITKNAVQFLATDAIKCIKQCTCGDLYLDTTKNHNRRYCNPVTCGNIQRSKKYLERLARA